jgi:prephenate dehydrogenase (NADP+)
MNIGIIGLGDMGKLYAKAFAKAGYTVCGCDLPANRNLLEEELTPFGIKILDSGKEVSSSNDLIIYSVEADKLDRVVAEFAPYTKAGAIVAGQTSVKTPEIAAFEKHLPDSTHIITFHGMHGPGFEPKGANSDTNKSSQYRRCRAADV